MKDGMVPTFNGSADISAGLLDFLAKEYVAFRNEKQLPCDTVAVIRRKYANYQRRGILYASVIKSDGQVMACHIYLGNKKVGNVILQSSFSLYRSLDVKGRQAVGHANRYLHWADMVELKRIGFQRLDWGGYNMVNEYFANISKFKKEFGGDEVEIFEGDVYRTGKAKILKPFLLFRRKHLLSKTGFAR